MVFRRSWMDKKDPRYGSALPRLALPRPPQIRAGQGHQWRPRRYWPLTPRPWKRRTAYVGARGEPSPGSGAEGRDGELGRVHEELVALRIKVEVQESQTEGRTRTERAETAADEARSQLRAPLEQVQRLQRGSGAAGPTHRANRSTSTRHVVDRCWETFTET